MANFKDRNGTEAKVGDRLHLRYLEHGKNVATITSIDSLFEEIWISCRCGLCKGTITLDSHDFENSSFEINTDERTPEMFHECIW